MGEHESEQNITQPGLLKKWIIAIRPFALPASSMPVIFGTVLAVTIGRATFKPLLFVCSLLAMMLLHSGANVINDIIDYKKGLDTEVTPVSGAVVRGYLSLRSCTIAAVILLCTGSALGLYITYCVGPVILYLGLAGVFIGVFYTLGPWALKYHGLGDLAVFLDFGILGALGAWTVQTGFPSWTPVIWAIPMSMLVVGILHANNWRDAKSDTEGGIKTVALQLGDRSSQFYYGFLIFGAIGGILFLMVLTRFKVLTEPMPLTFIIILFSLPFAIQLWKKAVARHKPASPEDFVALDGATARFNLVFGVLCTLALFLHVLLARIFPGLPQ